MATIAENLARIQSAKTDIKEAIEAKGVTVPSSATIDTYADYVASIPSGGGSAATPANLDDWTYDDYGKLTSATANTVGAEAFTNCASLTDVTIGSGVTSVGQQAFSGCYSLTSVTISDSVITIDDACFYECFGLTDVTIGSGITSIGQQVFYSCNSLTSVMIQATTPPTLGTDVFTDTPIEHGEGHLYVPEESVDEYKESSGFSAYSAVITCVDCSPTCSEKLCGINNIGDEFTIYDDGSGELTDMDNIQNYNPVEATVGDIITTIGTYAFASCSSLTDVTMPDSVTSIGDSAFEECENLTGIIIPSGVTYIGKQAFLHTKITGITIPSGVTSINEATFRYCTSLASVTIPSGVTSIGDSAFRGCSDLTSVTVESTIPPMLGEDVFSNTLIEDGQGFIYVPDESLVDYQGEWRQYGGQIRGISEL